jgi:phosphoserine phosphatase
MNSVLVLIAAPGSHAIDAPLVKSLAGLLGSSPSWLADREAVEFFLPAHEGPTDLAKIEQAIAALPIDIALLPVANRRKHLLLADMDSTMIDQECVDELAVLAGVGQEVSDITRRAMGGELGFESSLRQRIALMSGLAETAIAEVLSHRITFKPGGATLVATMIRHGARTALVSGGFVQFTSHVAKTLGFHEHRANRLVIENGKLSGGLHAPILGNDAKLEALHEITSRLQLSSDDVVAVGDGANDIPMLRAAGLGVALHAKPKVRAETPVLIDHGDLTALLYLQGYRRDEFAVT